MKKKNHVSYQTKQLYLMNAIMAGLVIGFILFCILILPLSIQLKEKIITPEQYDESLKKNIGFFAIYGVLFITMIITSGFWMKLTEYEYQNTQIKFDSMDGSITIDEFDKSNYLIQTNSDSVTEVKTEKDLVEILKNTDTYDSLVKSAESGIETFNFDQAQFLKQKLDEDRKKYSEKTKKFGDDGKKKDEKNDSKEVLKEKDSIKDNDGKEVKSKPETNEESEIKISSEDQKNFIETVKKISGVLKTFKTSESSKLYLYFREVKKIKRTDDPEIDPDYEDDIAKDRLGNINGMFYLLDREDKERFSFKSKLSPLEFVELRKAYIDFTFACFVALKIPFFVDSRLITTKKLTDTSIADTKVKALGFLTHLSLNRQQELRTEIEDLRLDNINLKRDLDKKRDEELQKLMNSGALEHEWRKSIEFKKINATSIVFAVMSAFLGIFIGRSL